MVKVLFVGDLHPATNYGAVATTEALMDLVKNSRPDIDLKIIDWRSVNGNTPMKGYRNVDFDEQAAEVYQNSVTKKTIWRLVAKNIAIKFGIYKTIQKIRSRDVIEPEIDNVPCRLEDYDQFVRRILNGETWQYEYALIKWANIIIVNSEGSIVNGTDKYGKYRIGGRYFLFIEYLSKVVLNKKCYVVNHTVDPKNRDIYKILKEVYPKLDGVYVRELMSLKLLNNLGISNAKYVPDALWAHDFEKDPRVKTPNVMKGYDFSKPYICIGDSSGIINGFSSVKWDVVDTFTRLINEIKSSTGYNVVFVDGYNGCNRVINDVVKKNNLHRVCIGNCNYHELYFVLKNARAFVSGRWHASIIALLGKTPILLWGADSHKTEALYGIIDYPYEFFDVEALPLNIDRVTRELNRVLKEDHFDVWKRVDELKSLAMNNVDMLRP